MNAWILSGFGIECEKESFRFCEKLLPQAEVKYFPLPAVLGQGKGVVDWPFQDGDLVFFPGGFSFSDHFGAGRLLAYELKKSGLHEFLKNKKCFVLGVCNGFQVLTALKFFGESCQLKSNEGRQGESLGFINRWVRLKDQDGNHFELPVRHGEGNLKLDARADAVEVFFRYDDEAFSNGSDEQAAGLIRKWGKSTILGMMPHPEVAAEKAMHPNFFGSDYFEKNRPALFEAQFDGVTLLRSALEKGKFL